jgi:hypothetical protein
MCSWRTLERMPKRRGRSSCRVFVSHKQQDLAYAERIAYGVTREGLELVGFPRPSVRLGGLTFIRVAALPRNEFLMSSVVQKAALSARRGAEHLAKE